MFCCALENLEIVCLVYFRGAIVDARFASKGIPSQLTANWSCLGLVSQTVTYLSNRWRRNVLIGKKLDPVLLQNYALWT